MVDAGSKLLKAGPAIPDQAPSMVIHSTKLTQLPIFSVNFLLSPLVLLGFNDVNRNLILG